MCFLSKSAVKEVDMLVRCKLYPQVLTETGRKSNSRVVSVLIEKGCLVVKNMTLVRSIQVILRTTSPVQGLFTCTC
jgi:hypothetical protein